MKRLMFPLFLTVVVSLAATVVSTVGVPQARPAKPAPPAVQTGPPVVVRPAVGPDATGGAREVINLDAGWRFAFGHATDMEKDFGYGSTSSYAKITSFRGPVRANFDDANWREVDLPHDWVPELPFVQEPASEELVDHGFKPVGRVFPQSSIGWYRRRFTLAKEDAGKRIAFDFDGVFRDCQVWLNGVLLGRHEGGYSPFGFDATDVARPGAENILTVRVDATQGEGWFYEGAGIYRHVWLVKTAPAHIPKWGVVVTSRVEAGRAVLAIATDVTNDADQAAAIALESQVVDPAGRTVATLMQSGVAIGPWKATVVRQTIALPDPVLWSIEKPALYRVVSTVRSAGRVIDVVTTRTGIRTIRFDADKGFFLNGRRVQIQGVCNHQDHAGVGAAVPDRLQRFRIERLKDMGVNAYRTSHNPPAPEILEAADELGMLVMDETRLFSSSDLSLEHLRALVRRDRNHPSVILWSIGNEEPEQDTARGNRIAKTMIREVKALDTTRPVTYASNSPAYSGINELVDVRGFNYWMDAIDKYHQEHPKLPLVGSEIASTVSTRGEYAVDKDRGYLSAYDRHKPEWGELAQEWMSFFGARPWLAGGFVWTGFDYRGEPTPYKWPCISSHFGIMDTCGFPKDLFWYYKAWWTTEPVLHLLPHWNWKGREGETIEVWAFTNADEVRLWLNGRDLGARKVERFGHAEWQVKFEPGRLEAVGYRGGKELARAVVETTGAPSAVILKADRTTITADGRDLAIITVSAVDAQGRAVPVASNDVAFAIAGPGRIIGVGNGDPSSHEADTFVPTGSAAAGWMRPLAHRRLFNGLAQVLVQSTGTSGDIIVRGVSEALAGAPLTLHAVRRE